MVLVTFRAPEELAERIDQLAQALSTPWHRVTRTEAVRHLVELGLEAAARSTAEPGR